MRKGPNARLAKRKSAGVSHPSDARSRRTRECIDAAFIALLHARAYDGIRVSQLARKSGVGRATFYAHYDSKDALLRSQLDRLVTPLIGASDEHGPPVDATAFFAHVLGTPGLYRSLMGGRGRRVVEEAVEARLAVLLGVPGDDRAVPSAIAARVIAFALMGLVSFWIERGGETSARALQDTLREMVGDGRRSHR